VFRYLRKVSRFSELIGYGAIVYFNIRDASVTPSAMVTN
jgi:hypothetical protein